MDWAFIMLYSLKPDLWLSLKLEGVARTSFGFTLLFTTSGAFEKGGSSETFRSELRKVYGIETLSLYSWCEITFFNSKWLLTWYLGIPAGSAAEFCTTIPRFFLVLSILTAGAGSASMVEPPTFD